jgi:hypothetical protein
MPAKSGYPFRSRAFEAQKYLSFMPLSGEFANTFSNDVEVLQFQSKI